MKSGKLSWVGQVAHMGIGDVHTYIQHFVGEPEGKKPAERPRRRWAYNIRMNLKMEWQGVTWIYLAYVETSGGLF